MVVLLPLIVKSYLITKIKDFRFIHYDCIFYKSNEDVSLTDTTFTSKFIAKRTPKYIHKFATIQLE